MSVPLIEILFLKGKGGMMKNNPSFIFDLFSGLSFSSKSFFIIYTAL